MHKCLILWFGWFAFISLAWVADAKEPLEAFPPAKDGMIRHVIELPEQENEELFRVELIVGKTVEVDPVNQHFLGGNLQEQDLAGWGYSYFVLEQFGPLAGTLMAAPEGAAKVEKFVRLGGEARFLRYNSKVPLVVYLPEAGELRWRLWRAGDIQTEDQNAAK